MNGNILKLLNEHSGGGKTFLYTGKSMKPTFKNADILRILPYHNIPIRCGDVIVFNPSDSNKTIVHRIVSINPQGIKTMGDNNPNVDDGHITSNNIIGRVVSTHNGKKELCISRGLTGILYISIIRLFRIINRGTSFILHYPYDWLSRLGIFRRLLPARLKIRIISFNKPTGSEMQLLIGRRVVGKFLPGKDRWQIQRPFRIFIDEASLLQNFSDNEIK